VCALEARQRDDETDLGAEIRCRRVQKPDRPRELRRCPSYRRVKHREEDDAAIGLDALLDDGRDEVLCAEGQVCEELRVRACNSEECVSVRGRLWGVASFRWTHKEQMAYDEWDEFHAVILQVWRHWKAEVHIVRRGHLSVLGVSGGASQVEE
jgi:hypothetical protein